MDAPRYTEVRELIDAPDTVTDLIDGGGWDLLQVASRKRRVDDGIFTDEIVYVVGHRADAQ